MDTTSRDPHELIRSSRSGPTRHPGARITVWDAFFDNSFGATPPDDVGFLRALIVTLQAQLHPDPTRVYVTGLSNGGSKIISGKLRLNVRPVDMRTLVGNTIDTVRPAVDAKRLALQVHVGDDVAPVSADPDRLQQVLRNLLSNAVTFTPEGGRIDMHVEEADGYVDIAVSDTGSGIAPEFLPHGSPSVGREVRLLGTRPAAHHSQTESSAIRTRRCERVSPVPFPPDDTCDESAASGRIVEEGTDADPDGPVHAGIGCGRQGEGVGGPGIDARDHPNGNPVTAQAFACRNR